MHNLHKTYKKIDPVTGSNPDPAIGSNFLLALSLGRNRLFTEEFDEYFIKKNICVQLLGIHVSLYFRKKHYSDEMSLNNKKH